ncbi:hypothetical protein AAVH_39542 [Aphelenchoides avenae]|nr:hypothetical protein AAVH_39542 [Aphelenchus avenae]
MAARNISVHCVIAAQVIVVQLPLSLLITLLFCKITKRTAVLFDRKKETELVFEQFQKQINFGAGRQSELKRIP